jgi:hypothetical protein
MLRLAQILPAPVTVSLEKRPSSPFRPRSILPRRLRGHFFGLLFLATIAFFFHYNHSSTSTADDPDYLLSFLRGLPEPEGGSNPPRFYEWHDREKRLPQHDVNLPYPQGREGRYIRFTNQVWGTLSFFFPQLRRSSNIITKLIGRLSDFPKASAGAMQCKRCCSTPILRTFPSERRSTPTFITFRLVIC